MGIQEFCLKTKGNRTFVEAKCQWENDITIDCNWRVCNGVVSTRTDQITVHAHFSEYANDIRFPPKQIIFISWNGTLKNILHNTVKERTVEQGCYSRIHLLGNTGAAKLHAINERSSATLWIMLWPVDIMVKWVALISYSLEFTHLRVRIFQAKHNLFRCALTFGWAWF